MKVRINKIPNAKSGAAFSPEKAKKILREKNPTLQGHKITAKQRRWLGWQAGGAKAENGASLTPLADNVVQFNGDSHEQGGIPVSYGKNKVEVEGGETGYQSPVDNSLHVMGNMTNPLTNRKFKEDSKRLAEKERKVDKLIDKSTELVNKNDPTDKWQNLSFNAGKVMLQGGIKKKREIADNKEWLATLQKTMLEHANELGADPQEFSKGRLTKAKNGYYAKAQAGWTLDENNPLSNKGVDPQFRDAFIKMMSEAPDFVKQGTKVGSGFRTNAQQKDLYTQGMQKYGAQAIRTRVAVPGRSAHEFGLAADLQFSDPKAKQWLYDNAKNYGIDFPLKKDDPNHMVFTKNLKGNVWRGPQSMGNYGPEDITTYTPEKYPNTFPKFNPNSIQYPTTDEQRPKATPSNYDLTLNEPQDYWKPSNAKGLSADQILPELYTAATNKPEPVWLQQYRPQLFQPYQVSFQDRLNENTGTFNALARSNAYNPAVQSVLASQKYQADTGELGEEFRTNQAIEADVVNKNISLLNDAQLKNLGLADTQYVRQAQTKSKVREQNQTILDSISNKLKQNQLEQRTLQIYENLYPNFSFDEKNNMKLRYSGPNGDQWINWGGGDAGSAGGDTPAVIKKYDKNGRLMFTRTSEDSAMKNQLDAAELTKRSLDLFREKRNLMAPSIQRQAKYKPKTSLIGLNP